MRSIFNAAREALPIPSLKVFYRAADAPALLAKSLLIEFINDIELRLRGVLQDILELRERCLRNAICWLDLIYRVFFLF